VAYDVKKNIFFLLDQFRDIFYDFSTLIDRFLFRKYIDKVGGLDSITVVRAISFEDNKRF